MKRVMLVLLLIAAGCSDGAPEGLQLDDPWARPSPDVATTAAFFLTIGNQGDVDETLVGVATAACRVTELHRSSLTDGVMSMQQMEAGIEIPASTTVVLQPGGLHIMCIDKIADFVPDEGLELGLEFVDGTGRRHTESVTAVVEDR
jgi:copper(I)-binding protein